MRLALSRAELRELQELALQLIPAARLEQAKHRSEVTQLDPTIPGPIEWCERVSGQALDAWQRRFLLSTSHHFLMNCSRQVGKTQIVSLKAAYNARHRRRAVVALAPTLRQSSKIHNRAQQFLKADGVTLTKQTGTELFLLGGGSVIALPGDRPDLSIRSETVDDLIVDEASRVKDSLIIAASPTTATRPDSTISYLSSPAGKRGKFYQAWQDDSDLWEKFSIKAEECPRITAAFLAIELKNLGPLLFSQEYGCEFIADATAVLDPEAIAAMFRTPGQPEAGPADWAAPPVVPEIDPWSQAGRLQ